MSVGLPCSDHVLFSRLLKFIKNQFKRLAVAEILCFVLKCFRSAVRGTDLKKPQNFPFFKLSNY